MIDLRELDKTIDYLKTLRKEEEERQLKNLSKEIEKELINEIENVLLHFESNVMIKFLEETKKDVCFDYNYVDIMENIKDKIKVDIWEVK